jgi:hypothetical protein
MLSVEDAELGVGLAVRAGAHARGEELACFVGRDGASSFARGVAAAHVDLDGRASVGRAGIPGYANVCCRAGRAGPSRRHRACCEESARLSVE